MLELQLSFKVAVAKIQKIHIASYLLIFAARWMYFQQISNNLRVPNLAFVGSLVANSQS